MNLLNEFKELKETHNANIDVYKVEWEEWLDKNADRLKQEIKDALDDANNWNKLDNHYKFRYSLKIFKRYNSNPYFDPNILLDVLFPKNKKGEQLVKFHGWNTYNAYDVIYIIRKDEKPSNRKKIDKLEKEKLYSNAMKIVEYVTNPKSYYSEYKSQTNKNCIFTTMDKFHSFYNITSSMFSDMKNIISKELNDGGYTDKGITVEYSKYDYRDSSCHFHVMGIFDSSKI